jgi:multidrug resistance protein, MATE family
MGKTTSISFHLPGFLRWSRNKHSDSPDVSPSETSSLLPKPYHEDGEDYDLEDGEATRTQLIYNELRILLKGSVPVILAYALQNSLQTFSVMIVGRGAPEDLAAAAFSYMFAMCTAWLIGLGGSTAIDTLGSSTFTGSKSRKDLGTLLQRSYVVLGLFYIPICVLWIFSEPLFLALGQDPQISRKSAQFLSCLVPGGLGYIYFEATKKYLQAQGM